MGKGDRRTTKGKRNIASYGNARSHSVAVKKAATPTAPVAKKAPAKKAPAKKAS